MSQFGQGAVEYASNDYTYCLFVPLIFGYLVYLRWPELEKAPIRQSNLGLGLLILGVAVYWFGMRANNQYFGYVAVQILLAGMILWALGPSRIPNPPLSVGLFYLRVARAVSGSDHRLSAADGHEHAGVSYPSHPRGSLPAKWNGPCFLRETRFTT